MTYDTYRYLFLGSLLGCILFLVLAVVLFFVLQIPRVISDLTGRTAKKAIAHIRMQNEMSGDKAYQTSAVNMQRGKLTDKISQSGRLVPRAAATYGTAFITEKISTQQLDAADGTDVLSYDAVGETDVLSSPAGETAVLAPMEQPAQVFAVEYEITFIHTNEVIA